MDKNINPIQTAEQELLHPAGLDVEKTRTLLLDAAVGLDWADIYFQRRTAESWRLEDGAVKTGAFSDERGAGLRALRGETTAFAGSDIISPAVIADIRQVAKTAKTYGGKIAMGKIAPPAAAAPLFPDGNPIAESKDADKIALLQKIDRIARAADSRVENVIAHAAAALDIVLVLRADGKVAADIRPLVRISVSVIIAANGKRESGHGGGGAR
ncbi:MAG: metalloprotease TldD, partial [Betaproteobacteria bacterium]|nr:metalloprotease TldD [Betaproteobacteria bacterium]